MLAIRIKHLKIQLGYLNPCMEKNALGFKLFVQNNETSEQMAVVIYFFYLFANTFMGMYAQLGKT